MWRHTTGELQVLPPAQKVHPLGKGGHGHASGDAATAESTAASASSTNTVAEDPEFIVVGLGMAGSVVAARLAQAGKNITVIEIGGPMQAETGGISLDVSASQGASEYLRAAQAVAGKTCSPDEELCYVDIPGEYNNVAFQTKGNVFMIRECAKAGFQGMGYGGNGVFNGMLYQEPAHWWLDDEIMNDVFVGEKEKAAGLTKTSEVLLPFFEKVRQTFADDGAKVTAIPSTDGVHYNHGLYNLLAPTLAEHTFAELPIDSYDLQKANDRFFGVPTVVTKDGVRNGPQAWLNLFLDRDGKSKLPNVTMRTLCKATSLITEVINGKVTITGVNVEQRDQQNEAAAFRWADTIHLRPGGKVILCCGSLPTVRLLYLSGIGPKALEGKILKNPNGIRSFSVNNPGVGTACSEHVTTSLGYRYTGTEHNQEQPNTSHFDPADYVGNKHWLAEYQLNRRGPYCQFGPVVACHFTANVAEYAPAPSNASGGDDSGDGHVTTELFFNPIGMGAYPPNSRPTFNPYNGPGAFSVYCMLLRPMMRAVVKLLDNDACDYTPLYMSNDPEFSAEDYAAAGLPNYKDFEDIDQNTMAASIYEVLQMMRGVRDLQLIMGPGDGQTMVNLADVNGTLIPYGELDPTNKEHVKAFCNGWNEILLETGDPANPKKLYITRLQENHFNSTAPLSRNLDVFGKPAPENYGVNPDTMEVRGVEGLCVADASLFPKVVYCHPVASVFAIAEYASDKILSASA